LEEEVENYAELASVKRQKGIAVNAWLEEGIAVFSVNLPTDELRTSE
jgi:hypothetical protein